nr:unnamed protein product [Naegleria fowleri]
MIHNSSKKNRHHALLISMNNTTQSFHMDLKTFNSSNNKKQDPDLSELRYITVKTPEDVVKNSNVIIEWLKKEGDLVEDNEIVCRIDRQPMVGDEIREIHAEYKGKIHKISFQPAPTQEQIGEKLKAVMSPNQDLFILETTEGEIRSQEGIIAKLKRFVKKYGILGVVIYLGIYVLTLGTLFLLLQEGFLATKDVLAWLHNSGFDKYIDMNDLKKSERNANFVVAWVLTKFTEPVRMAVTLAITPYIYKVLRRFMRK